jgi:hypothetical protein
MLMLLVLREYCLRLSLRNRSPLNKVFENLSVGILFATGFRFESFDYTVLVSISVIADISGFGIMNYILFYFCSYLLYCF